ncbi:MAG: hypothetical protein U0768_16110 [Anaerolineae bacterium]
MKRLVGVAVLVVALTAVVVGSALAQGPAGGAAGVCPYGLGPQGQGGAGVGPGRGPGMGGQNRPAWAGMDDEIEALLGLTDSQLHTERAAGKSLAQIAQAKGVTRDTLVSQILAEKKADVDKAVADGKLTQAQAGLMLARMQSQVPTMVDRTSVGPAFGPRQGQGPMTPDQGRNGTNAPRGPRWSTP